MKLVLYLIHLPMLIAGWIAGTIWFGLSRSFQNCIIFWDDDL